MEILEGLCLVEEVEDYLLYNIHFHNVYQMGMRAYQHHNAGHRENQ